LTLTEADNVGLISGSQFKIQIRARNKAGVAGTQDGANEASDASWAGSEFSDYLYNPPKGYCLNAPTKPTDFMRQDPSAAMEPGTIKLRWVGPQTTEDAGGDPEYPNDASRITYEVEGGPSLNTLQPLSSYDSTLSTFTWSVPLGQTWKFRVRTVNVGGITSAWEGPTDFFSGDVPGQPTLQPLTSTIGGQVTVIWDPPIANGGTYITGYLLSYDNPLYNGYTHFNKHTIPDCPDAGTPPATCKVKSTVLTYDFVDQNGGALVTYAVRALNSVGWGPADIQSVTVA